MRRSLIPALIPALVLLAAVPAAAQDAGGLSLSSEALAVGGPRGLARPLPFTFPSITAGDVQGGSTADQRRARNRDMVARLRGDGGFLDGFSFGQPRAASRQPPPPPVEPIVPVIIDQRTRIVNNLFEGPVAITRGDNNIVQQQGPTRGSGPSAQQQVVNTAGAATRGGGATNVVTPGGNIVQTTPR